MAAIISKEDILKAAQTMTKDERLKLIAEIAALPESVDEKAAATPTNSISNEELINLTNQFIDKHRNLLRRLAE